MSSVQQRKFRKRSSGICRGTSDAHILIFLPLKQVVWILRTVMSPIMTSFMWSMWCRLRQKKFLKNFQEWVVHFSSIQARESCMLNFSEHSTSGTCRKMSMFPNGGSGSNRMSALTKNTFYYAICSSLEYLMSVQEKEARDRNWINIGLGISKETKIT